MRLDHDGMARKGKRPAPRAKASQENTMRPYPTHEEPLVEEEAEGRPGTPSLEPPARPEFLENAEAEGQGSIAHKRPQPDAAAHAKTRRKPGPLHWETLLRSRPWPDKPAE
jgi:hypothetical protein